jgi:pyruvate/2-oxoglutarate dehydrogenase complex dihydrolipoamide dehydrogenase (E3) component
VRVFANAPRRASMRGIVEWLEREVKRLGVEIIRGAEASPDEVVDMEPDAVIVATGGHPFRPDLPGFDAPNVFTAWEVLEGTATDLGPRVLVIDDDAHHAGPAVADLLAGRGHRVEIVTRLRYVGEDLSMDILTPILRRLFSLGVVMTPHVQARAVREASVVLANAYTGSEELREVDSVVLAMGSRAVDGLYHGLQGRVPELHLVGDAMAPRRVHTAMLEGARAARAI